MAAGDSWKTESGLLDDYDITFAEAWFGTDPIYRKGEQTAFFIRGNAEQDGEIVEEDYKLIYGLGDGWKAAKNGTTVVHDAGKTSFNRSSNIGRLIDRVASLGDDVIEEISGRGEASEADTWIGLRFHMERQPFTFKDRNTNEETTYEVPLPTEYLGTEEVEAKPAKASSRSKAKPAAKSGGRSRTKAAEKPAARSRKKAEPEPEDDGDLRAEVVTFASDFDADAHDLFLEAIYDVEEFDRADEIDEDEDLAAEVMDPDSDLWDEAHS